jgi:hypothetical protein
VLKLIHYGGVAQMRSKELIALAFTLVLLGIIFADDWLISYSLIGAGLLLSIISAIKSRRKLRMQVIKQEVA